MKFLCNIIPKDIFNYVLLPYYRKYIKKEHKKIFPEIDSLVCSFCNGDIIILYDPDYGCMSYNIKTNDFISLNGYLEGKNCTIIQGLTSKYWLLECIDRQSKLSLIITNPFLENSTDVLIYTDVNLNNNSNILCDDKYVYIFQKNVLIIYTLSGKVYKKISGSFIKVKNITQTSSSKNYIYTFDDDGTKIWCNVYSKRTFTKVTRWELKNYKNQCYYIFDNDFIYVTENKATKIKVYNALTFEYLYAIGTEFEISDIVVFNGIVYYFNKDNMISYIIEKN